MNLPRCVGFLVFFFLPILLWLTVAAAVKRRGPKARLFALIAGSDNRLSLSRLQAFAWTLVIFGSFAAAMAIHTTIIPGSPADIEKAQAEIRTATDNAEKLKPNVAITAAAAKTANDVYAANQIALREAETKETSLAADAGATPENKNSARQAVVDAKATAEARAEIKANADKAAEEAKAAAEKADQGVRNAVAVAKSYNWVDIPAALLALAGIAIGSGVFSSLISAVNSEDKTACVISLGSIPQKNLKELFPDATTGTSANALSIIGKDMGSSGAVRLNRERVPILLWKSDGTQIIVDVKDGVPYKTLTVDTGNGKLCHGIESEMPGYNFGTAKDLLRILRSLPR